MLSKKSKPSDKQNVELFKFFETQKEHRTSPRSKKTPKPISIKLPQRRTTRLKSEIFVENYPQVLPDGEYDIDKEDFNTTLEPLTRENKSCSDLSNSSTSAEHCDLQKSESPKKQSKLTKLFEKLETIVSSYTKSDKDQADCNVKNEKNKNELRKQETSNKRTKNLKANDTDIIESIDVNAIANMLKDTSFEKDNYKEEEYNASITTKKKKKRKRSENSEQSDIALQRDDDFQKVTKKSKNNSNDENNEQKLNKKSKPKDKIKNKESDYLQNNTDHCLYDDNPQLSLTVSDEDDEHMESISKIEKEKMIKESTKKKHKSSLEDTLETSAIEVDIMNSNHKNFFNDLSDNLHLSLNVNEIKTQKRISKNLNNSLNVKKTSSVFNDTNNKENNVEKDSMQSISTVNEDDGNIESFSNESNIENTKSSKKSKKRKNEQHQDLNSYTISPVYELMDSNEEQENNNIKPNHENYKNSNNDLCDDNNVNHKNSLETSLVEPKKRGRKPKNLNSSLKEINTPPSSLCIDNKEKNVENDAVQPKKRGRKPKILNVTQTDKNTSTKANGILNYFTATKKKFDNTNTSNENLEADNQIAIENSVTGNSSEGRITRSRISNNLNTTNTSAKSDQDKSGNVKGPKKSPINKLNKSKELQNPKKTKMCKLTKDQIKRGSNRKIPKNRLDEILEMVDDEDHPLWEDRNISCNAAIYTYWESRYIKSSEHNMKIRYARQFLLRRDWVNLSKVLSLHNSELSFYYPLLSKYATILMAHTNSEQFDKLIQYLTSITDSKAVIKKCTKISKHNED
ncbi:uncharacterized protein ACRADG_004088 [Cochliomyia hominivorax]